jgi:hypothetical protein
MSRAKFHPWHLWSAESGLTGLLVFTLAYLFATCALGHFSFGDLAGRLLFTLIILSGVLATFTQRWIRFLVIFLAVAGLPITWLEFIHPGGSLTILDAILRLIFLGLLLAVLIVQVFQTGSVTAHRIRGAIVVYLLLGGMWSLFYQLAALTIPHSFHFPGDLAIGDPAALQRTLTYFSFTTLTTTGFGDITPITPLTRTLAMFEALTGQLYLVITLARLVSLAVICPRDGVHPKT